jgi:hypothetical protein
MKRAAVFLVLAAAACTPPQKSAPQEDLIEREVALFMAVGVQDTSQLSKGQWAGYSVRTAGSPRTVAIRLAVVDVKDGTYWIENRTTSSQGTGQTPRTLIMKYQIDESAKPLQIWMAELGGNPTQVFPRKDGGKDVELPQAAEEPKSNVQVAEETITISATGKQYDCTRLTSKASYQGSKETTLVTWCSKDVPFSVKYAGKSYGGVVRRTYGNHTLELEMKGTDAVPMLKLPEK